MAESFFYTRPQIEKIGNAIIYLATHIPDLTKTKLLKILYILEETSIGMYGFPFFNIRFDIWKFGPVSKDIYVELSDTPNLLSKFIDIDKCDEKTTFVRPKIEFDDDEFSDNDIAILEYIATYFKNFTATQLVELTHRKHSAWYQTAQKHGLLERFELGQINCTNIEIDFSVIFDNENLKAFYLENKELLSFSEHLKD